MAEKVKVEQLDYAVDQSLIDDLTPAERAGMLDPDLVDGQGTVEDQQAGEDDDGEAEEPVVEDKATKKQPKRQPAVVAEPEDDAETDSLIAAANTDDPEDEPVGEAEDPLGQATATEPTESEDDGEYAVDTAGLPRFKDWRGPENAEAEYKRIDDALEAVADRFEQGELSAREMSREQTKLLTERTSLQSQVADSARNFAMNKAAWDADCALFMKNNPAYGDPESRLFKMINQEVMRIQSEADDPFDPAILQQARKAIDDDIVKMTGRRPGQTTPKAKSATGQPKPKIQLKPTRPKAPPVLANMPSADITETSNTSGRFAALDALAAKAGPKAAAAHEAAMERLSTADRERYLSGNY